MRDFLILFVHLIVTLARLARPGGLRSVVAESALLRHQLLVLNRGRKRAPNLRAAGARGGADQDHSLRAAVASVCRAIDWHSSARVPRQDFILDHSRSGDEAIRFSTLL